MNYLLFDGEECKSLLPFTYTRPTSEIRVGILTIREKWERHLGRTLSHITRAYLAHKYASHIETDNVIINGAVIPNLAVLQEIETMQKGESLVYNDIEIAWRSDKAQAEAMISGERPFFKQNKLKTDILILQHPWQIFLWNGKLLNEDFDLLTVGRKTHPLNDSVRVLGHRPVFVEEGAEVSCAILNAHAGPIYLGKNSEVMEGAMIRGPFALCEASQVKMGAKIYGDTTIGPYSKVAGEISNSVIFGNSNKAHDGFVGNSVIGEWCNLGADTNTSNLKNNYSAVRVWDISTQTNIETGLQFCGLLMGDHSKCGINTMFNTGTVVGVSANIFGGDFPPKYIPSFSWGGAAGLTIFRLDEAIKLATAVFHRRNRVFDENEKAIFEHLFGA